MYVIASYCETKNKIGELQKPDQVRDCSPEPGAKASVVPIYVSRTKALRREVIALLRSFTCNKCKCITQNLRI